MFLLIKLQICILLKKNNITNYYQKITKEYKKTNENVYTEINKEANHIAQTLEIENKMEALAEKNAYITLKDHKENFINQPKCRLINPTKSELGVVSSIKIKHINFCLRNKLNLKQWINTNNALNYDIIRFSPLAPGFLSGQFSVLFD